LLAESEMYAAAKAVVFLSSCCCYKLGYLSFMASVAMIAERGNRG